MFHFFETRKRSILKALSWKIIATAISFNVLFWNTGNLKASIDFSGIIFIIGIVAYYVHERLWNMLHWEKSEGKEHRGI